MPAQGAGDVAHYGDVGLLVGLSGHYGLSIGCITAATGEHWLLIFNATQHEYCATVYIAREGGLQVSPSGSVMDMVAIAAMSERSYVSTRRCAGLISSYLCCLLPAGALLGHEAGGADGHGPVPSREGGG